MKMLSWLVERAILQVFDGFFSICLTTYNHTRIISWSIKVIDKIFDFFFSGSRLIKAVLVLVEVTVIQDSIALRYQSEQI